MLKKSEISNSTTVQVSLQIWVLWCVSFCSVPHVCLTQHYLFLIHQGIYWNTTLMTTLW